MNEKLNITKAVLVLTAALALLVSCNHGLSSSSGGKVNGQNERRTRGQRIVIDAAKYVDFTVKENNAAKYTKFDILNELSNTFRIKGGNSYITIDRTRGTITLSSDDAWYKESGGHNMFAKYVFDVQAANSDCLYIKMDGKKKAQLIIDNESMVNYEVPDLLVCLPLYGFSRSRIEVSPVMDGFIAMPSGTYWIQKN